MTDAPFCPMNGGPVTPGERYQLAYHVRGTGFLGVYDATNKAWIDTKWRATIAEKDNWRQEQITFIAPKGCVEVWFAYQFEGDNASYVDDVSMVWAPKDWSWIDCDLGDAPCAVHHRREGRLATGDCHLRRSWGLRGSLVCIPVRGGQRVLRR